jgi:tight adherence protein C
VKSAVASSTPIVAVVLAFLAAALAPVGLALIAAPSPSGSRLRVRGARLLARIAATLRPSRRARPPRDLEARIVAAGRPAGLGPSEVMVAKLAAAAVGGLVGAALALVAPGRVGLILVPAGPVAGFLAPDHWLTRRAAERARGALRELPTLLDLLRVTVEAGLALPDAFAEVGERTGGALGAEWRSVGREVALGVPASEALAAMTRRLPLPEVAALVAALDRAARHGALLADTLAAQALEAREARRRRIHEEAARAAPKIQLVVALLLVPSVMLLVAAALTAALLGGGGTLLGIA